MSRNPNIDMRNAHNNAVLVSHLPASRLHKKLGEGLKFCGSHMFLTTDRYRWVGLVKIHGPHPRSDEMQIIMINT